VHSDDLDLAFVTQPDLFAVLDRYYRDTRSAAAADSYLGVIVGCGAVVEGLLTWALLQNEARARESKNAQKNRANEVLPIEQWSLASLISVSADLGVIGTTAKQASWALKDFRNFVHPYNVLQQSARPDASLAASALAATCEIVRSMEGRLPA
jgi:hypothetical protein